MFLTVMTETCTQLYESMLAELQACREQGLPALKEIECCFSIACSCWNLVRKKLARHLFTSEEEEINFFKFQKPRFISEIIFYELLNHLEIFLPDGREHYRNLLLRERTRLEKLAWSQPEFFEYYKSGRTDEDRLYFLRCPERAAPELSPYDREGTTCTSKDYLAAQILALERYDELLQKRLAELDHGEPGAD
jgi:hypothetical protein